MDQPYIYQFRVHGQLDHTWSEWLGGLTITHPVDGETLLTGPIPDQAALHGTIDKLYAMNSALISILRMDRELE